MRKTISMIMIFVFGVSLWADVSELNNDRKEQAAVEKAKGPYLRDNTDSNDRDATYTVDIYDSWGDGWNGASLDVIVNGAVVLSGLTLTTGSYATFDLAPISVGDVITTAWTAGEYDYECYFYIYNDANFVVAEGGTDADHPFDLTLTTTPTHIAVYFSEYSEGASNNKYLEIYNGTDAEVDLTGLAFASVGNAPSTPGDYEYWNTFDAGSVVAAGDVFVIGHPSADAAILAETDQTHTYLSNGDDGYCLVLGTEDSYTILDCIGDWNADPGSGWDVAGIANATKDNTLERKGDVIFGNAGDWVLSAGTNLFDSEWTVSPLVFTDLLDENGDPVLDEDGDVVQVQIGDWDGLGSGVPTEVLGCTDAAAGNYDATATIDDGSCVEGCTDNEYVVTLGGGLWDAEITWNITDEAGTIVAESAPVGGVGTITVDDGVTACLANDGTNGYYLNMFDDYGDGWNSSVFTLWTAADSDGDGVMEYTEYFSATLESGASGTAYIPGLDDVFGCMDPTAENYNSAATVDDGSCTFGCDDNEYVVTLDGGTWQGEVSWEIVDAAGAVVLSGGAPITVDDMVTVCLANDGTNGYYLNMIDSYGDGWNGNVFTLWTAADSDGDGVMEYTEYFSATLESGSTGQEYIPGLGDVFGCTDPTATNYDATATIDDGSCIPSIIQNLSAQSGIESVLLSWDPLAPLGGTSLVAGNGATTGFSSPEEWREAESAKYYKQQGSQNSGWEGKTRSQLLERIAELGQNTRDTEVLVTLYDSYGDGTPANAYIKDATGAVLHTLAGGWQGYEAAYGPFTLADGQYDIEWDEGVDTWLYEQSAEITLVSDGSVVGSGLSPTFCFALGAGYSCASPGDLVVSAIQYDPMTGFVSATVTNIGELDLADGGFTVAFLDEPDMSAQFPPGWFCFAATPGIAAGESIDLVLSGGDNFTDIVGSFDGLAYTIWVAADGNGQMVVEGDETNNVSSLDIVNTNPLANATFSVWRDYTDETSVPLASVPGTEFFPGAPLQYLDNDVTSGTQYCYLVTQVEGTLETNPSNESCATPSAPPVVTSPSELAGSSSGFDMSLSWTAPYSTVPVAIEDGTDLLGGGENISAPAVLTSLGQQTGTNVGSVDDYEEDCGSGPSTAGDVVYSYTPDEDMVVDISACYSTYDTKIFVYENEAGQLANTAYGPALACSDDDIWYGENIEGNTPCTDWTSFIRGLMMTAGNTYYIVVDGWGNPTAGEGNYVLDFYQYEPLQTYTIWDHDDVSGGYTQIGFAPLWDEEWSSFIYAAQPFDLNLHVTADYKIPGIFSTVSSDPIGPVNLTLAVEDNPNNLMAMDHGDDVHLMWDPPIDASQMELRYDDGAMSNAYDHSGVAATRFRVSGTYAIKGFANGYWTGGWPDATLGQVPITLSLHSVDPATDMPGDAIYVEEVYVDADPTSETYGWAMATGLEDNPLVVTGDVFFAFSEHANEDGSDSDVMGCDAVLDFPANRYYNGGNGWDLDVNTGTFANCGDWMMRIHADFTVGDGTLASGSNGAWIDQSGDISFDNLPDTFADVKEVNTKENPVVFEHPTASNPVFASRSIDRDMMHYNIYRDGVVVGDQQPGVHEYMDAGLDWGTYTYHVTAMYDDHESIATNMVEVTLSNVPPNAVMLISPGDNLEVEVDQDNLEETVAFIWTAAIDSDNDPVEYWLNAEGLIGTDTVYGGAPDFHMENEGFEDGIESWLTWPTDLSNFDIQSADDAIYGSSAMFDPFEGMYSLKIWGQYSGTYPNNTPVYQGFNVEDHGLSAGDEVVAYGAMMSHADDWIGQGTNSAYLFISFFDEGWNMLESTLGPMMDGSKTASEWHQFDVRAQVPAGAVNMNVGVEYWQVSGGDHGSVYFDEVDWYSPVTTTGLFVPYEDLAMDAFEAGVTDITWEWDVWSFDGFEVTPSQSGPRQLHVNLANLLGIENASLPKEFALHNNYPNPFNPVTNIVYDIPEATDVTLEIYNVMGQRVRTLAQGNHEPGRYQIVWSATNDIGQALSSGMYIYRIQAGDFVSVKKLVLMK